MKVKRLKTLGLEIFKTLHKQNSSFIEETFHRMKWLTHRSNKIQAIVLKATKFSDKSLTTLGPRIWNSLPEHIKEEINFIKFKE